MFDVVRPMINEIESKLPLPYVSHIARVVANSLRVGASNAFNLPAIYNAMKRGKFSFIENI